MTSRRRTRLLAALEAFVAVGAWAGTVGFVTGAFDSLVEQLPWESAALGAVALAGCVAVPTTVTTVALLQRRGWAPRATLLTASVLAAWLVGQTAFVGLSAFQPAYLVLACVMAALASSSSRSRSAERGDRVPSRPVQTRAGARDDHRADGRRRGGPGPFARPGNAQRHTSVVSQ
jgi:hypothetical protein